ncbi:unnamed protein product [Lymnaea stagnalis]|uniref:[histone H4]-lysine(20) N-methyltransferase n=1 Tax=Lymnaea stagnalis TaxID=6523 RepID=A0AAV2HVW6_LYMST
MKNQDCKDRKAIKSYSLISSNCEPIPTPTRGKAQAVSDLTPDSPPSSVEDSGDSLKNAARESVVTPTKDMSSSLVNDVESLETATKTVKNEASKDSSYKAVADNTDLEEHTTRKPKTSVKESKVVKTKITEAATVSPSVPKTKVRKSAKKSVIDSETQKESTKAISGRQKKKTAEPVQKNTITNYYPVRRSGRQTKSEIEKAKQHQLEQQIKEQCEDGLEIKNFENKGRGIVATKVFRKGDFVVEYAGDLIDLETAKVREEEYALKPGVGCYMYYFSLADKQYCVDATAETNFLGRLVNHSRDGNCCTKAVMIDKIPHLILIASRDIPSGEELCYDYGDRRREALEVHPWLKL